MILCLPLVRFLMVAELVMLVSRVESPPSGVAVAQLAMSTILLLAQHSHWVMGFTKLRVICLLPVVTVTARLAAWLAAGKKSRSVLTMIGR
jgi:hypothetical protein